MILSFSTKELFIIEPIKIVKAKLYSFVTSINLKVSPNFSFSGIYFLYFFVIFFQANLSFNI